MTGGEVDQRFRVDHRPERVPVSGSGCLWGDCDDEDAVVVSVYAASGEQQRSRVCETHLNDLRERTGVSVEVKDAG